MNISLLYLYDVPKNKIPYINGSCTIVDSNDLIAQMSLSSFSCSQSSSDSDSLLHSRTPTSYNLFWLDVNGKCGRMYALPKLLLCPKKVSTKTVY